MSVARIRAAGAVLDGKLYVVGGKSDGNTCLSSVECLDPATNTWDAAAPMSMARAEFALCCMP